MKKFLVVLSVFSLFSCSSTGVDFENKDLSVRVEVQNDTLFYTLDGPAAQFISKSPLLLDVDGEFVKWSVISVEKQVKTDAFDMLTGETSQLSFEFTEGELGLKGVSESGKELSAKLIARLYDDAFAYRFVLDLPQESRVKERSEYNLNTQEGVFYTPNGESEPIGPVYIDELDKQYTTPVIYGSNAYKLAFHESDLHNYPQLMISKDEKGDGLAISSAEAVLEGNVALPWRVVLEGESFSDLHNAKEVYKSLAQQPEGDFSWVKPGISVWDWRVKGTTFNNHTYEMTTESLKRYIDFCANNKVEYFLIDDQWYDEKKYLVPVDGLDLKEVVRYGVEKGVGMLLYYDLRYVNAGLDELDFDYVASTFASWGVKGIKYGFLGSKGTKYTPQQKTQRTEEIIRTAAKHKLIVDFHDGPVPFGGLERQYPNYINREYCHAQMDRRWAFTPGQFVKMACVNMLAGPIDQTNGTYALNTIKSRSKGPFNEYYSTVASETARFFITHTGNLAVLIDAPEAYEEKSDIFDFIKRMPDRWDETKYLNMDFESCVSVARRHGDEWFVGTVFAEKGGRHELALDFLEEGKTYKAIIYRDAKDTDYITNKESYEVVTQEVTSGDKIAVDVANGGGYSVFLY